MGSPEERLTLTRLIDAPRELVFAAWTDCAHFVRWWGPRAFTAPHCSIDLRPGGRMHYCMRSPDGRDFWGIGTYREIVEPERIVFLDSFADEHGEPVSPERYGMSPDWPAETTATLTLDEQDGRTRLLLHSDAPPGPDRDAAEEGWNESLDKLEEYLAEAQRTGEGTA